MSGALLKGRQLTMVASVLACLLVLVRVAPPPVTAVAGLWLVFGGPSQVWTGVADRAVSRPDSRLLVCLGLGLGTEMVTLLVANTVLPLVGLRHPLAPIPIAVSTTVVVLLLGALLPQPAPGMSIRQLRPPNGLGPVAALGTAALVLSVAGPIRLNNGYGSSVSTAALVVDAVLVALLLTRRRRYGSGAIQAGLYIASLSLLLLTSLRGWYVTGHDIQREYQVFELALDAQRWNVGVFPDAYNACLSITLLPVAVVQLAAIPGIYVFKVILPLLFALTPLLVYRSVRSTAPRFTALLSAVFFMVFPTYFTDMPFLGRQEIAFVLTGCAMVVLTDAGRPLRHRRLVFGGLLLCVVLSHYSTTYVLVAVFGLAFAADRTWRLHVRRRLSKQASRRSRKRTSLASGLGDPSVPAFLTWWLVLGSAAFALVWAGPITHTSGQLQSTLASSISDVLHFGQAPSGSSDTGYSLFGGSTVTPAQRLTQYRAATLQATALQRAQNARLPLKVVDQYGTSAVPLQNQPLTGMGRLASDTGVSVSGANTFFRQSTAKLLQLLLLLGVLACLRKRPPFRPVRDQYTLTLGAVGLIAVLTVLPQLSVDYGVLRAFQQGLFFFAPFIAAGTLRLARWLGRWSSAAVCTLMVVLLADLTGVVPAVLGGYPAQLNLSNSGQYYDIYYTHAEELSAMSWLQQRIRTSPRAADQVPIQTDRFTYDRMQTLMPLSPVDDIYPTMISPYSYAFLGTTTTRLGQASLSYRGDLVTYTYPVTLLDLEKDEIYASEGASIFL